MALSHRGAIVGPGWVPNIYSTVYSGGATVLAPQAGGRVVAQRNGVRAWRSIGAAPLYSTVYCTVVLRGVTE